MLAIAYCDRPNLPAGANADTAGRAPFNRLPCIGAELGRKKESFPSRGHVWDQGLYVGFEDGTAGMDVLPP